MHHLAFHSFKSESHKFFFSSKGQPISKWPDVLVGNRLAHTTLGQASMEGLEQENQALREEMATMQAKIDEMAVVQTQVDELTEMVQTLRAAQYQPPPPPPPVNTQAEAGPSTIPGWTVSFNTQQQTIPEGHPCGVHISLGEVFRPYVSKAQLPAAQNASLVPPPVPTAAQATIYYSAPVVHAISQDNKPIFHSGSVGAYYRVHDL